MNAKPYEEIIDGLELAFKSFVSSYCPDTTESRSNRDLQKAKAISYQSEAFKITIEEHAANITEKAKNLEILLLKDRLEFSRNSPESLLREEIDCLAAELSRKTQVLNASKERLSLLESSLRRFNSDIENNFKNRLDTCAQVLFTYEPHLNPLSVSSQHGANQSFDQPSSLENSIIAMDSNKNY